MGRFTDPCLKDGKLVSTEARHEVDLSHVLCKPVGDGLEQPVSHLMPKGVIDVLEMVEVEKVNGEFCAAASRSGDFQRHILDKGGAVRQTCQGIMAVEIYQLFLGALAIANLPFEDDLGGPQFGVQLEVMNEGFVDAASKHAKRRRKHHNH